MRSSRIGSPSRPENTRNVATAEPTRYLDFQSLDKKECGRYQLGECIGGRRDGARLSSRRRVARADRGREGSCVAMPTRSTRRSAGAHRDDGPGLARSPLLS